MKVRLFLLFIRLLSAVSLHAQDKGRYVEVTGNSEIEIVPDKIHFIIEIREYFVEEFDGKSKPEEYRTKVPLEQIETQLRKALSRIGIGQEAIRTQEVGDFRRKQGQDFLISKTFDITLTDFNQMDKIVKSIDTKGVNLMRIGELENNDILSYHKKGKIEALKAAQQKATYLVEALGKKLGDVISIEEKGSGDVYPVAQSNVMSSNAGSFEAYPTIKKSYSMLVRFEIVD